VKVFLTGASSGIGEALARHYAAGGATVGLVARRADVLAALKAVIPGEIETYAADVRNPVALREAAAAFMAKHGAPDIVIGNAGVSFGNLTELEGDVEAFREILEINVLGLVNTFHPFIGPMRAARRGTLVGIASVAGFRGIAGATAYSASKAAAIRYLEGLRVEMRPHRVRVVTICPGYIDTPMTAKNPYKMPFIIGPDDAARRFARVIAAGRGYAVVPWQMAIVGRIWALLPNWIFDRVAGKAGRKPRRTEA